MAIVELSAPGKTFLLGEYLAIKGGPSFVLTTDPRFKLRLYSVAESAPTENRHTGIHALSPAGLWFEKKLGSFVGWNLEFIDPHAGIGGLGASSAQFALVYVAEIFLREGNLDLAQLQWSQLLSDYRSVAWNGEGEAPSGADVVAQLCGGLTHYDGLAQKARVFDWPFANEGAGIAFLHTGKKLATHEYLRKSLSVPEQSLRSIVAKAEKALTIIDFDLFAQAFQEYAEGLSQQGWVAEATVELLLEINKSGSLPGVNLVSAKGCGAMGTDIIALLYRQGSASGANGDLEVLAKIEQWLYANPKMAGVRVVGSTASISAGLRVEEIGI